MRGATRRGTLAVIAASTALTWAASTTRCCAEPHWVDHRAHGPFRFHATFPLGSLTPFFQELSSLELELQRTLAVPPAGQPIDVYLFDDENSYRTMINQLFPQVSYRRALYVQRAKHGSIYAFWQPELAVDLRHECTHALLHANLAMVPLWLDEGLAEYFEMPEPQRASEHPHLSKLRWNLRFGMVRSIESLESCSELDDMEGEEYRFAWAWIHFMLHGPLPAHRALVHYLRDIERGDPPGKLSERLRAAVPNLDGQFAEHFKKWRH